MAVTYQTEQWTENIVRPCKPMKMTDAQGAETKVPGIEELNMQGG